MSDCYDRGILGLGSWDWIIIIVVIVIIFCPGIFGPKVAYAGKCNPPPC